MLLSLCSLLSSAVCVKLVQSPDNIRPTYSAFCLNSLWTPVGTKFRRTESSPWETTSLKEPQAISTNRLNSKSDTRPLPSAIFEYMDTAAHLIGLISPKRSVAGKVSVTEYTSSANATARCQTSSFPRRHIGSWLLALVSSLTDSQFVVSKSHPQPSRSTTPRPTRILACRPVFPRSYTRPTKVAKSPLPSRFR